jgi:hypothetical protein
VEAQRKPRGRAEVKESITAITLSTTGVEVSAWGWIGQAEEGWHEKLRRILIR